jgi:peptide deformylase
MPSTNRLVDVPIIVHVPPSIEVYDKGSKSLEAERDKLCASVMITGIIISTIDVLLIKNEPINTTEKTKIIARILFLAATVNTDLPRKSITPVFSNAALKTNIDAIVIAAGFANTCKKSLVVINPDIIRKLTAQSANNSMGAGCFINPMKRNNTVIRISIIGIDIILVTLL